MEWSPPEKQSVRDLLDTICEPKFREDVWNWLLRSIQLVGPEHPVWQVAQMLLLIRTTEWPLALWRQNINRLRQWQLRHCTVTAMMPDQLYDLFLTVKDSVNWSSRVDHQRFRILILGIFVPGDWRYWSRRSMLHSDLLNCSNTFLMYKYQTELHWEPCDFDDWKHILRQEKRMYYLNHPIKLLDEARGHIIRFLGFT